MRPRGAYSDDLAASAGFAKEIIPTHFFHLTTFSRITDTSQPLSIYIEGDGLSWYSRTELSADPTPGKPVALELATKDPSANVVYVARPCQHSSLQLDALCQDAAYWSNKRFAEEVVASVDDVVGHFVSRSGSQRVILTGFSGGAAVAALVAVRRNDVSALRSVAGNLDSRALSDHHRVTHLSGSLDPIDVAPALARLSQVHWIGSNDKVIPPTLAHNFKKASGNASCLAIVEVPGASHLDGWASRWRELLERYPPGNCV